MLEWLLDWWPILAALGICIATIICWGIAYIRDESREKSERNKKEVSE